MTFLKTVSEAEATGDVKRLYDRDIADDGFVSESTRALTTRAEILPVVDTFLHGLKQGTTLTPREYKLVTLVAAARAGSSYCGMIYGRALVKELGSPEAVQRLVTDYRTAGLSPREVAMLEYADKISTAPSAIAQADIDRLRAAGLSDQNIFDVALCACFRQFLSRMLNAVGADTDPPIVASIATPALRDALSFGRR